MNALGGIVERHDVPGLKKDAGSMSWAWAAAEIINAMAIAAATRLCVIGTTYAIRRFSP